MKPILKTLIFTLIVPGSVTVVIPLMILPSQSSVSFNALTAVGGILCMLGVSIYLKCAWDFAIVGRGTPAPIDPPTVLVAIGSYRRMRNPMYVGAGLILIGEAMMFSSLDMLFYFFCFFLAVNLFIMFYEEPALRRKFGEEYEAYCRQVPRWIPRRFTKHVR